MQAFGSAFNALVSLGVMVFLGRTLGLASFGEFVAWLGFATLALIVIEGGWPTLVYRESVAVAGQDAARGERLAGYASRHLMLCGASLAMLAAVAGTLVFAAALACMTLVAAMNLVSARLRGAGRFGTEAAWQMSGRSLSAIFIALAVWSWPAPGVVFLAWAFGLLLVLVGRARLFPSPFVTGGASAAYAFALPFVLVEGLSTLVFKGDVALLKLFGTAPAMLSDYAACTRFNEAALLLGAPVANVMLRAARQRSNDARAFTAFAWRVTGSAALAGAAMWLGALLAGDVLVRGLFGTSFDGALLAWTASALIFALPSLVLVQLLIAGGAERGVLIALACGALVLVAALGIGAAHSAARGAAVGLALAQAALFAGLLVTLLRSRAR